MKSKIGLLISILITSQAYAADSIWHQHKGTNYAEVDLGTNLYYLGVVSSRGTTSGAGVSGIGLGLAVGHYFTDIFALEGGLLQSVVNINSGSYVDAPYFTTRFSVPMSDRFSFIGKIGAMYPNVPNSGGFIFPFTGIGISYAATPKVDWNMQYQGAFYGVAGAGVASVGLTYHFD